MGITRPATKVAAVCIGIIALGAIICFCIIGYFHLDKTVLIPRQTEFSLELPEGEAADADEEEEWDDEDLYQSDIGFFFLTNAGDTRRLADVTFAEAPEIHLWPGQEGEWYDFYSELGSNEVLPGRRMGVYRGGQIDLNIGPETLEFLKTIKSPVTVKTAVIRYENESEERIEVDPITFHPPGGNNKYQDVGEVLYFTQAAALLKERGEL
ncbi:hypothetical protein NE619_00265 [Anaerovorax odorimutans]|uniref:Uncharacterized protein n=1 Tax=Anaerovorax odorimutans TaxID=109327 RepID=A0ABT1RJ12_9FIRM|nr:hypothetical protein [Anaerovorax odorimutans]MCQ4635166.1 hypothetical protein [Anaerovorax odorimutans]